MKSVVCSLLVAWIFVLNVSVSMADTINVWLGTGRSPLSQGIYHCKFDTTKGSMTAPRLVAEMQGPGFLAKHPKLGVLYAIGGMNNEQVVAAFRIEPTAEQPSLTLMNAVAIGDGGSAHLAVDPTGITLLTAQYGNGSVAVFALNTDGSVKERTQLVKHQGGSRTVEKRQDSSHAHWVGFSPDNRFAFVPDLGLDQVVIYKLNAEQSRIERHGEGVVPPGSGPRHMKFHPNGKWIYVLNELSLTISVFDYDAKLGVMVPKQTIETVPAAELAKEKAKSSSEIRVNAQGTFVYSANRGHDTISAFQVNATTGELTRIQIENARAVTPRNFHLTPDGNWLLAAGQASNSLASFAVNKETGMITYNQECVFVPTPICIMFDE